MVWWNMVGVCFGLVMIWLQVVMLWNSMLGEFFCKQFVLCLVVGMLFEMVSMGVWFLWVLQSLVIRWLVLGLVVLQYIVRWLVSLVWLVVVRVVFFLWCMFIYLMCLLWWMVLVSGFKVLLIMLKIWCMLILQRVLMRMFVMVVGMVVFGMGRELFKSKFGSVGFVLVCVVNLCRRRLFGRQ